MEGAVLFPYPPDEPDALRHLARRCLLLAARASAAQRTINSDASMLGLGWQGRAARACRAELRRVAGVTARVVQPIQDAAGVLQQFAAAVDEARATIDRLRTGYDDVARQRLHHLRGAVVVPPQLRRLAAEDIRAAQQLELAVWHRRYADVLDRLRADAAQAARALRALAADVVPEARSRGLPAADSEALLVSALPMLARERRLVAGSATGVPPPGTPAGLVRAWWRLLTVDEQDRLVEKAPTSVGNLDGLPAAARGRANELVLDRLLSMLRALGPLDGPDARLLETCTEVRRALDRARGARNPRSGSGPAAQLVVFEPRAFDGDARAAISVGDADTADHVAFLVPGLGSSVRESMRALVGNAVVVAGEAARAAHTTTTAAVAWMGYDAPEIPRVAGDDAAEEGADLLAADVLAVQAARDVSPHLSVIGHSYGSTTTGTALRDHATGVDAVVLVGSPGANVDDVRELAISADRVFVGASSRDPVSYLDWFGLDPAHERFGAVRFQAEDVARNSWRLDVDDHSRYFQPKTESMANIVHIVVGSYAEVQGAAYREEVPFLPDGMNSDPEADREPTVPAG